MGTFNWMVIPSFLLLLVISQSVISLEDTDDGIEDDFEDIEDRQSLADYYGWDDGRAGCKDQLPSKMTSDSNCKKLKKTCAKLKSKCSSKLGSAIGTSSTAKKCKNKLGSNANKKVRDFCKITCNQCANGKWTNWGAYGACSKTCGPGTKTRKRTCTNPKPFGGGTSCPGSASQSAACNVKTCPIHGNWASWGDWTACSTTCGPDGMREKNRTCTDPAPMYDGDHCNSTLPDGVEFKSESCNTDILCPVDGGYSTWGSWGLCSLSCGNGTRSRERLCDSPAPVGAGLPCVGDDTEYETCNPESCDTATTQAPVDGNWGAWGAYSSCSKTCGTGIKTRSRECDDPAPVGLGEDCVGDSMETALCNTESCTDGEYTVTSEMTFSSGVTEANFDSIKSDLIAALASVLGVAESSISLSLKSDLRSSSIIVVVTITTTSEDAADDLQDSIDSSSFVSSVNTQINSSGALAANGVVLDYVSDSSCGGCTVPTLAPKRPKKCKNRLDYRKCGKAAMKGKCFKSWWQYQCKATCKRCCGDIWGRKRCKRLKFLCKKKNKNGRDVRNKCRKTCGKC